MESIAPFPADESFFALPIAQFQRAIKALSPLRAVELDRFGGTREIVVTGTSLIATDRYTLGRWETEPSVSIDGSFRAAGIVFGQPFLIPEDLRRYIAGIRAADIGPLAKNSVVLHRAGGRIELSVRGEDGKTRPDVAPVFFEESPHDVIPVERIVAPYPLTNGGTAVDPVRPFVAPTWPVRLDPAALAKLARCEKKNALELHFTDEHTPVYFRLGKRFDGLLALPAHLKRARG